MSQYIFSMNSVGKLVDNQRYILKDISLSFIPGAKIGVLGLNGSGKSTLLKIMAEVDTEIVGEIHRKADLNIGYLPQEPKLDEEKTVKENIEEGFSDLKAKLAEFDEISMKFAEPMADDEMNELLTKQGELQNEIEARGGWELDRKIETAARALSLPD